MTTLRKIIPHKVKTLLKAYSKTMKLSLCLHTSKFNYQTEAEYDNQYCNEQSPVWMTPAWTLDAYPPNHKSGLKKSGFVDCELHPLRLRITTLIKWDSP